METYAEENIITSQPRKRLISSFMLQNHTLITLPFLFSLELGLVSKKITASLRILLQGSVSKASYSQQLTNEYKVTRIQTPKYTKCRFHKLTNVTVFAALLKDVPMDCKDALIPKPLLITQTTNCFTFGKDRRQLYFKKLGPFRALALHLHSNQ